jgi:flagella basal body P-ring formation protein FlgA
MGLDPRMRPSPLWRWVSGLLAFTFYLGMAHATSGAEQVGLALREYLQRHPSLQNHRYEVLGWERIQRFPGCQQAPDIRLAKGDRPWGKVYFQITCSSEKTPWTRTIGLEIRVMGRYLTLKNNIAPGAVVQATDLEWVQGEVSRLGAQGGWIEDAAQLTGLEAVRGLQAGTVLRLNDFRDPTVIKSGDLVKLSLIGQGFEMVTSGTAMGNAAIGATVRVKLSDGKVLQGKALSEGRVEAVLE